MNQIDTGKFIAGCRKEKGLTQAQLAEKLNITDRAVSKWETGVSHMFVIYPFLIALTVIIPAIIYRKIAKTSIIERLHQN